MGAGASGEVLFALHWFTYVLGMYRMKGSLRLRSPMTRQERWRSQGLDYLGEPPPI